MRCCLEMAPSQKGTWGSIRSSHLGRRPDQVPWAPRDGGGEESKPSASSWAVFTCWAGFCWASAGGQINTPPSRASSLPHPRGLRSTRLSPHATRLLPPAGCVTHGRVYTSNLSPSFHSLLPQCVHRSVLHTCVSIPALHTGATAPLSRSYTHTRIIFFSSWLASCNRLYAHPYQLNGLKPAAFCGWVTPHCVCTTTSLSIYLLVDIWDASMSWLLQTVLWWECKLIQPLRRRAWTCL